MKKFFLDVFVQNACKNRQVPFQAEARGQKAPLSHLYLSLHWYKELKSLRIYKELITRPIIEQWNIRAQQISECISWKSEILYVTETDSWHQVKQLKNRQFNWS